MTRLLRFDAAREDAPHREALREAFDRVLASGRYLLGAETAALTGELLTALDAPSLGGLPVASGTDALVLGLRALGVGPDDEVITVANAGAPGPTAIRRTGARVVFCDVDPHTLLMDPASAAARVGPRTRALLPVHLFGSVVDVDALRDAAPGIPVLEDCAQAFGSRLRGRAAGTLGDAAAFSFYPTKNLGALGDAGFVLGPRVLIERATRLARYGADVDGRAVEVGTMSRIDELQAAALRVKLARFDEALGRRAALASLFDARLPAPLSRVGRDAAGAPAVHLYVVRLRERERMRAALLSEGIATGVHYPTPAHRMPAFSDARALPVTEQACREVCSLPFFPSMAPEDVERVATALEAGS